MKYVKQFGKFFLNISIYIYIYIFAEKVATNKKLEKQ